VLLALWLSAPEPDRERLLDAVQADDEPHTVRGDDQDAPTRPLAALVDACDGLPRDVAVTVPAPGDLGGTPAAVSVAAVDAGECVLVRTPQACLAAVPVVERFGSHLEPGHLVTWDVAEVPDWRLAVHGATGSLADAERELKLGLVEATEALMRLDVARWRPEAAETLGSIRDLELPAWRLPRGIDGRRVRVLASAVRLRAIVALAGQDDGGAVNLWQADQRSTALREIDRMARRAMAAAATTLAD
jgi:hypothetical protein